MDRNIMQSFIEWYNQKYRPFFIKYAKDKVPSLDDEIRRMTDLLNYKPSTTVCFLGNSGIGKSTLLNALAADGNYLLPAGGVGPLTAQATEVHYADVPQFTVNYHDRASLWNMVFGIESQLTPNAQTIKESVGKDLPDSQILAVDNAAKKIVKQQKKEEDSKSNFESNFKIAHLLVKGDQFSEVFSPSSPSLPYVVDALRLACGYEPRWNQTISESDQIRIQDIKRALHQADTNTAYNRRLESDNRQDFMKDLHNHAAGFLSPLIQNIQVGWPSDLLKHDIILVDLPGVGIASDIYRNVTQSYVREKARVIILVVDRAGPTDATIDMLKSSGYWERLLGASDDPDSDLCTMCIAVTKVDDVVNEEWRNRSEPKPRKSEIFSFFVESFKIKMRNQITNQLNSMDKTSDQEEVNAAREIARKSILNHLEVHPISAPEFRKICLNHEDDMPFLRDPNVTGIPHLRSSLVHLAEQEQQRHADKLNKLIKRISSTLKGEIRIIKNNWKEQRRIAKEVEKVKEEFESFFSKKRDEYTARIGGFRQYLDETVPSEIGRLVLKARLAAQKDIYDYFENLKGAHWATLKAAVKKGGAFDGSRNIDLAGNIIQKFQEPIAAVWSQNLLKNIRSKNVMLSKDIESLVEELCAWAEKNATANISPKLLKNQRTLMSARTSRMDQIGQDAVDELRNIIKARLTAVISQPIRDACNLFVNEGNHEGAGVKQRILALFQLLSQQSITKAETAAITVLKDHFNAVRGEIHASHQKLGHPLKETANLIIGKHRENDKTDIQQREQVLAEIRFISETCPISEDVLQAE